MLLTTSPGDASPNRTEAPARARPPADAAPELAALWRKLRAPPYYHIVPAGAAWLGELGMEGAMRALAAMPGGAGAPPAKLSFTRVRIDPAAAARANGATHYSRTHLPLALHTDGSNMIEPHQLIAFHMIRSDRDGGDSTTLPLPRLLKELPAGLAEALREPVPFGRDALPILWGPGPSIRYYRAQIDAACAGSLPPGRRQALDELDRALARPGLADRFRLHDGDVLFVNNRRALHGRTGFAPASARLMLRYRIHAPALD